MSGACDLILGLMVANVETGSRSIYHIIYPYYSIFYIKSSDLFICAP